MLISMKILNQFLSNQTRQSIHKHKHCISIFKIRNVYIPIQPRRTFIFWSPDRKGGYKTEKERPSLYERMQIGLKLFGPEFKKFKQECKNLYRYDSDPMLWDPILINRLDEHGTFQKVWKFNGTKDIEGWVATSDSDLEEGYSSCTLAVSKQNKALFSGNVDTRVPKDGVLTDAGYCSIRSPKNFKSFKREIPYVWHNFTHFIIRCRGDGRPYVLNLNTKYKIDMLWHDQYSFTLYTRGGPYWQTAKIPFSKFFLTAMGRIQDKQRPLDTSLISSIAITQMDRQTGPFNLEIDYIAVIRDVYHRDDFWWELYEIKTEQLY